MSHDFVRNEHHIFGLKLRYKMMKAACDLVVFEHHQDFYPKLSPMDKQYFDDKSYKFRLPPRLPIKERILVECDQVQAKYTVESFRYISHMLLNSPICDAGYELELIEKIQGPVTGSVKEQLQLCFCPFSEYMRPFRKRYNFDHLFQDTSKSEKYDGRYYHLCCNCTGPMTVSELYSHCRKSIGKKTSYRYSPFHEMLLYFLEFQYSFECPVVSVFKNTQTVAKKGKKVGTYKFKVKK